MKEKTQTQQLQESRSRAKTGRMVVIAARLHEVDLVDLNEQLLKPEGECQEIHFPTEYEPKTENSITENGLLNEIKWLLEK